MIAFMIDKDLSFIFQSPKGSGMNDPIPISLKMGAIGMILFRISSPFGLTALGSIRS
jgi:hypothetical protein